MADLVTRLKLDSSQHNQELDKSKQKVSQYKNEADKASKTLDEMGKNQSRSAKELLSAMSKVEEQTRGATNYRKQLAEIQKTIVDLTVGYRNMSAEMQNSDFGREVSAKIEELTQKAATYKDAIGDVQREITNLSSDTQGWDAMKQGIDLVSSTLQTFVSIGGLSEKSTEKLMKVITKLKTIEAATNTVIKIGNALQRDSALMRRLNTIRTTALAAAENAQAAGATKAAIATRALNAAIAANPFGMIAGLIMTVISALTLFTGKTKEDTEVQKKHKEELEKQSKIFDDYKTKLGSSVGGIIGQYNLLRTAWRDLTTEQEKNKWIKENQTAFNALGIEIKDVNAANRVFVDNAPAVIEALRTIAEAEALKGLYQEAYVEKVKTEIQANKDLLNSLKNINIAPYIKDDTDEAREIWKAAGITAEDYVKSTASVQETIATGSTRYIHELNAEGQNKLRKYFTDTAIAVNQAAKKESDDLAQTYLDEWENVEKQAMSARNLISSLGSPSTPTGSGSGKKSNKKEDKVEIFEPNSLREAQHFVDYFSEELSHMDTNDEEFEGIVDILNVWKRRLKEINDMINEQGQDDKEIFPEGSLNEAEQKIREITAELSNMDANSPDFESTLAKLDEWKDKQQHIQDLINHVDEDSQEIKDIIDDIKDAVADVQLHYDVGLISEESAKKAIAVMQREAEKMGIHLDLQLDVKASKTEKFLESFSKYKNTVDDFSSSMSRAYDSITSLGDKLDEETDAVKRFFLVFDTVSSSVSALQSAASAFTVIQKALSGTTKLTEEDTLATTTNTIAKEINANVLAAQGLAAQSNVSGLESETTALAADTIATGANTEASVANAAAKLAEAGASEANTTANEAESGSVIKTAIAKMMEAIAGGAKAVASLGPIGPVLAIAAAAAITAALVSAFAKAKSQKFSTGGIYNSKSNVGDNGWARLNNGEMVLNTRQQKKLFQMLNSSGIIENKSSNNVLSGDVNFVIEADRLVGTLENYNRKISHSKR